MNFAPRPENDFSAFFAAYYDECRSRMPQIQAVAGKWRFEDLIPGLSDFDTRFIVSNAMTTDDWCAMSTAVGAVHLDLCRSQPHWARNLEHLPGINLTWAELVDPRSYYPEYNQWTFYRTSEPSELATAEAYLSGRSWDAGDEHFHLEKFCLYYGRYDRQIDPPINLARFENKYPLHSRFMHYFCPPVQSAMSILEKRPIRGKQETISLVRERLPHLPVLALWQTAIDAHYELPELYLEPRLTRLEDELAAALEEVAALLVPVLTVVPDAGCKTVAEWQQDLRAAPVNPVVKVFSGARFSRLMKGRLQFYAKAPPHFDSIWCIENELRRLRRNFFEIPFGVYWTLRTGEKAVTMADHLDELELLSNDERDCVAEFVRLLPGSWADGQQRQLALAIAEVFDGFFKAQCKIAAAVRELTAAA